MADIRDIIKFSADGEKIFGIVIEHYVNPLDDFYIVYADYAIHKVHNPNEESIIMIDNIIIPACDEALADFRLKRQHLKDLDKFLREINVLKEMIKSKMRFDDLIDDVSL